MRRLFPQWKQTAELWLLGTNSHTDLREELIHEGGVVHGDLHLVVILIACLRDQSSSDCRGLAMACDGYFACFFVLRLECQQQRQHFRINASFTASLCLHSWEIIISLTVGKLLNWVAVRGSNIWPRSRSRNRCVGCLVTQLNGGKNHCAICRKHALISI